MMKNPKVSRAFRLDHTNVGDCFSSPCHYFPFDYDISYDVMGKIDLSSDTNKNIIIGGGGLFHSLFYNQMKYLSTVENRRTVAWGVGHCAGKKDLKKYWTDEIETPDYVKDFDIVGIRDDIPGFRWVPCASCMSTEFDKDYDIKHDIIVYEHKGIHIKNITGFPRMDNNGSDLKKVIEFLGSGELIITNSYHGAYWATLLNRKVITFPWNAKFLNFKHPPTLVRYDEWENSLSSAQTYPDALEESRKANVDFYNDVLDLLL